MEIEEAQQRYMADPSTCPYCGGTLVVTGYDFPSDDAVDRRVRCEGCIAEFTETYRLVGVAIDRAPPDEPAG